MKSISTVTKAEPLKIYLVAGEPSGDALGGSVIERLRQLYGGPLELYGVGGQSLQSQGLRTLFPMQELSVMGFLELIPHIPNILLRLNQTVEDIIRIQPDLVVTIDAPGFNFRLGKKLKAIKDHQIPLLHITAPTVWAWKPKRAEKVARFLDHLLALFPFEPPYFTENGLDCTFMGHPFVEKLDTLQDKGAFLKKYHLDAHDPILCILPGSRRGEINHHLPLFLDSIELLRQHDRSLQLVFPTLPELEPLISQALFDRGMAGKIITEPADRLSAMAFAKGALAASGTVSLELALLGVPMLIAYRSNPISAMIARRMILIPYVSLPNILLNKTIVPELLQENCTVDQIYQGLHRLLAPRSRLAKDQIKAFEPLRDMVTPGVPPTQRAAEVIINMLKLKIRKG